MPLWWTPPLFRCPACDRPTLGLFRSFYKWWCRRCAHLSYESLGDDSYFYVLGTQVDLWVKKGGNACKITLYKQIPVEQKQALELSLAKQVVAKL